MSFSATVIILLIAVITAVFTIGLAAIILSQRATLSKLIPRLGGTSEKSEATPAAGTLPGILVDTSVIIDGRIADIAAAGFLPGRLLVPRFVLAELQNIADSEDAMRRGRGRRGLEVLNRMREMDDVELEVIEDDVSGVREVDAKLVALGRQFGCGVLTTDYNLNRVAQIQGVRILNVNELSNAIRPVVLPGEELVVRVVQPGKERNQGVGYLADGTMIVVEDGDKLMGQEVATEVTRVFQTVAGKMIFAAPKKPVNLHRQPVAEKATPAPVPTATPDTKHQPAPEDKRPQNQFSGGRDRANNNQRQQRGHRHRLDRGDKNPKHSHGSGPSLEDRVIAATNMEEPSMPKPPANPGHKPETRQ